MSHSCIAVQMYTLREFLKTPADIAKTLAKVKAIGYEAVQVSGFGPCDPAEVAKILEGEGLICASSHTSLERLEEELDAFIEEHHLWGCKHTAIASMPGEYHNPDGILTFASKADEIGSKLAQAGIVLSYHNHDFEFAKAGDKTWLEILYDNTDPKNLQAELDTYWVQSGGGDPAEWIRKYPGRMQMMHVKDMVIGPDGQRFAEIGEGNLNWPAILSAAKDTGVEWYCVEQDDCYGRDPFESLKISLENLHEMGLK